MTMFAYEERNAIAVIRRAVRKKPEIINELMKDMAHEHAASVLLQAKKDLEQLLEVSRAFITAAAHLAKQDKESSCPTSPAKTTSD